MQSRINLGRVLELGFGDYVRSIIERPDDSMVIFAINEPPKQVSSPVAVIPAMLKVAMSDFRYSKGDVKTRDWISTLVLEKNKSLNTPEILLDIMWLITQLEIEAWDHKTEALGYIVTKHSTDMEDNCLCCFKNSKPVVYQYEKIQSEQAEVSVPSAKGEESETTP